MTRHLGLALLVALGAVGLGSGSQAHAQERLQVIVPPAETHPEGAYGGVVPGKGAPPGAPARKGKSKGSGPQVSWVGFQPDGAGAKVFLQLDADLEVTQALADGVLTVTLPGAHLARKNEARPLDTRFFKTSVVAVRASEARPAGKKGKRGKGRDVTVTIRFKDPAAAAKGEVSVERPGDGFTYVVLAFPGA